jgi:hypothetical protein
MNSKTIEGISQQIYRQFPEVSGGAPSVKAQAGPKNTGANSTYLLTFKGRTASNGGPAFNRSVRVVATDTGRILKVTTSK